MITFDKSERLIIMGLLKADLFKFKLPSTCILFKRRFFLKLRNYGSKIPSCFAKIFQILFFFGKWLQGSDSVQILLCKSHMYSATVYSAYFSVMDVDKTYLRRFER